MYCFHVFFSLLNVQIKAAIYINLIVGVCSLSFTSHLVSFLLYLAF